MDTALNNALDALRQNGALDLPDYASIDQAPDGTRWHGNKTDGDRWFLIKHRPGSYNSEF